MTNRVTDLLLVHGWATDSYVWDGIVKEIAGEVRCHSIDLPGHGGLNHWDSDNLTPALREIEAKTETVTDMDITGGIIGIGWSLGAMALLKAQAERPGLFSGLILIGAGASFIKRPGFEYGQSKIRLKKMIDGMKDDAFETVEKFYPLNFTPTELEQPEVKEFINRYAPPGPVSCTEPNDKRPPGCYPAFNYEEITSALVTLGNIDLREETKKINVPTLIIHGTKDSVLPVEAGTALHGMLTDSKMVCFEASGHAPFITEQTRFNEIVKTFINEVEQGNHNAR